MNIHVDERALGELVGKILTNVSPLAERNQTVSQAIADTGWLPHLRQLNETWALNEDGAMHFEEVLDALLQDSWVQDTYALRELERILTKQVIGAHENHLSGRVAAEKLVLTLAVGPHPFAVLYLVDYLRLGPGPLEVGPVTFFSSDAPEMSKWDRLLHEMPGDRSSEDDVWAGATTCAEVKVETAPGSQWEVAELYIEDVLDYLRCYVAVILPDDVCQFGIRGKVQAGVVAGMAFDEQDNRAHWSLQRRGAVIPVEIAASEVQDMRDDWGLDGIGDTFSTPRWERQRVPQEMKQRLTLAIYWAARARQHALPILRLVDYSTAMETLLLKRGEESIRGKFANRLEYVLSKWCHRRGSTTHDLIERNRPLSDIDSIERWAKEMYDERSACIHGGRLNMKPKVEQRARHWWAFVALAAIGTVADNIDRWKSFDDFERDYQESKKKSGESERPQ